MCDFARKMRAEGRRKIFIPEYPCCPKPDGSYTLTEDEITELKRQDEEYKIFKEKYRPRVYSSSSEESDSYSGSERA